MAVVSCGLAFEEDGCGIGVYERNGKNVPVMRRFPVKVKDPTLSHKTREGWGTLGFQSVAAEGGCSRMGIVSWLLTMDQ